MHMAIIHTMVAPRFECANAYPVGLPVEEAGVTPPGNPLVAGENAGSLRLQEEDALAQRLAVVDGGATTVRHLCHGGQHQND